MPKEVHHALTPARVRQEKKPGRYADGNGLYLVVSDTGGRWWEWRGTVRGRGRVIRGRRLGPDHLTGRCTRDGAFLAGDGAGRRRPEG